MEVKYRNLLLSVVIVTIIYYLIFFSPLNDDITLPIRAMVTLILLGGLLLLGTSFLHNIWFHRKNEKIIAIPDIRTKVC